MVVVVIVQVVVTVSFCSRALRSLTRAASYRVEPSGFCSPTATWAGQYQLLPQGDAQWLLFADDRERWQAKTGHSRRGLGRGEKMLREHTCLLHSMCGLVVDVYTCASGL